mgnify:CR=1 FL=1
MVGGEAEKSTLKFGPRSADELEKVSEKLREAQAQAETVGTRLEELRKERLPEQLSWIPLIESAFRDAAGRGASQDGESAHRAREVRR